MLRILLAALVGGILEFAWGAASHMALGLFDDSFARVPNEADLLDELKDTPPGTYMFPWLDHATADEAAMKSWEEQAQATGSGILVRWPSAAAAAAPPPRSLALEFGSNAACALILALLAAGRGLFGRIALGPLLGLFAFLSQNASHWIWYHFSDAFAKAELIDAVAGWSIAGLGVALVLGRKPSGSMSAAS